MKFRTIIRMQMVLMTVTAALMLASSVYAQQDMDPTAFADGPNVTPYAQPVVMSASGAYAIDATNSAAILPAADADDVQEASIALWTPADDLSMTVLMVLIGSVAFYGAWTGQRERVLKLFSPRTLTPVT